MDQSSFAAPHSLSQRITSFFACACQGIHQMPLRHLIVLIANAHQYSHTVSSAAEGLPFTTQPSHDAIDVFDGSALLEPRRAARLQSIFKTSFSRLNPGSRGQATIISNSSDAAPKDSEQQTTRVTSFLPLADPSFVSGRLGHQRRHWNRPRTWDKSHTWKPPDQSSLHDICRTGTNAIRVVQTFISSEDKGRIANGE